MRKRVENLARTPNSFFPKQITESAKVVKKCLFGLSTKRFRLKLNKGHSHQMEDR